MNYLAIASIGFILNGVAILFSKFLLTKSKVHPLGYVFYTSLYSLIILVVLPYLWITHTPTPSTNTIILASFSTLAWTVGIYFLYKALDIGLADRVSPIIGTLNPVFLIIYYAIFTQTISLNETWGTIVIVSGLLFLVLPYLKPHRGDISESAKFKEILFEVLSGLFFAVSYILLKEVYNHTDFLSGLTYSRLILVPVILIILVVPKLKKIVFSAKQDKINLFSNSGVIFIGSQLSGGVSQLLIAFAVFLANPAVVNSIQGVQYAFLFVMSLILGRNFPKIFTEKLTFKLVLQNILGIGLIAFGLFILAFANTNPQQADLGFTFSPRYAQSLGLNPKITYVRALSDLHPKTVRLPIYWDTLEPSQGSFDFSESDYYVRVAQEHSASLTLVLGYKVPRFPECYIPNWAKNLPSSQFDTALYGEIAALVNHYRGNPAVKIWQVENEPLFPFGFCPGVDFSRLKQEVATVHQLDSRPVMVTESGEFGLWLTSAKLSDIIGTTLYRRTLAPYIPQFKSPLPPFFYQFKGMIVHLFFPGKPIYVTELQAEPWANQPLTKTSLDYQKSAFPVEDLADNVAFAKRAGFNTIYLWGVEWWYYLDSKNQSQYLDNAILIFNDTN